MKCGEQVHDEGIQARARVGPAKSLLPAGTWGDRGIGWRLSVSGCRGPHLHPAQPCLLSARLWAVSRQPEVCQAAPQGGQAKTQLHTTEPPICHQTNLFLQWDFFFSRRPFFQSSLLVLCLSPFLVDSLL